MVPLDKKPWVIVVTGPTATGKTALSVRLAKHLGTDIISADSQLVYQGLNIGTAKPTVAEQQGVPHHLMNMVSPTDKYTVAQYQREATTVMNRLLGEGKTPVFSGGTGYYLKSVLQGPNEAASVPPDPAFRDHMNQRWRQEGGEALYGELKAKDPRRAAMLYPQDTFRIIRALEIIHATGQPVPDTTQSAEVQESPYRVMWVVLTWQDREHHRAVIRQRVCDMMEAGWLDEVRQLAQQVGPRAYALQRSHGYPVLLDVLDNKRMLEDAVDDIALQVRQYARRQRTWFRQQLKHEDHVVECPVDKGLDQVWPTLLEHWASYTVTSVRF